MLYICADVCVYVCVLQGSAAVCARAVNGDDHMGASRVVCSIANDAAYKQAASMTTMTILLCIRSYMGPRT